jgi:GNAT superfamily N-acetyltransferase
MIKIVRGSRQDVESIIGLVTELLYELDGKPFTSSLSKKELVEWMTNERYVVFLAFDEQAHQPIGVITLTESHAIYTHGAFGVIEELYVKKPFRSRGIGGRLIRQAISFAKIQHWKRLEVGAPDKEHWMETYRFYCTHGFIEIGPRLKYPIE